MSGRRQQTRRITLRLPERVVTMGRGTLGVPIRLLERDDFPTERWQARCGLLGTPETSVTAPFGAGGDAVLHLPGSHYGQVSIEVEMRDRQETSHWSGSVDLRVDHLPPDDTVIHAGGHDTREGALVYQPVEVSRFRSAPVQATGRTRTVTVVLARQAPHSPVRLRDLLERPRILRLSPKDRTTERALMMAVGERLTLGRAHVWQLPPEATELLEARTDRSRIDWITHWDDPRVHRLVGTLEYRHAGGDRQVRVSNLSGYSANPGGLRLADGASGDVAPGDTVVCHLRSDRPVSITLEDGLELVRFRLREARCGDVLVPTLCTENTDFRIGGNETSSVRFLGAWIPWPYERLRKLVRTLDAELFLPLDDGDFEIRVRPESESSDLLVTANEDLRAAMERT